MSNPVAAQPLVGTQDFIQYWSAYQVAAAGQNPYDGDKLAPVQAEIMGHYTHPHVVMMWNPPWLLPMMAPVLKFDFYTANLLWIALNFVFFFSAILLIVRTPLGSELSGNRRALLLTAIGGFFYPAWDCIGSGQIGLFLTFFFALSVALIARGRDFLGGLFLIGLTVKPHLFLLFWPFLFIWCLAHKRMRVLAGLCAGAAVIAVYMFLFYRGFISAWAEALQKGGDTRIAVGISQWRVETFAGFIRAVGIEYFHAQWRSAYWAVPAVFLVLLLCAVLIGKRAFLRAAPAMSFAAVTALSVAVSPYGWFSDYSLLLPAQIIAARQALDIPSRATRVAWVCALVGFQFCFILWTIFSDFAHGYIFLLGFFLFGLLFAKSSA